MTINISKWCHVSVIQSEKHKLQSEYIRFFIPHKQHNVKFFARIWRWCIILTNFMRINNKVDKKWGINPANMFSHLYFMYKRFTLLVFTRLLAATKNFYTGVAWLHPAPTSSREMGNICFDLNIFLIIQQTSEYFNQTLTKLSW